jgi:hypothetical protein
VAIAISPLAACYRIFKASMEVKYISIGANRQTAAADCSPDGTLAFGADINVALWKPAVGHNPFTPLLM